MKTGSYKELLALLEDGDIRCILEIKEGYMEAVSAGKYRGLLNVYHEEGDNVATLVSTKTVIRSFTNSRVLSRACAIIFLSVPTASSLPPAIQTPRTKNKQRGTDHTDRPHNKKPPQRKFSLPHIKNQAQKIVVRQKTRYFAHPGRQVHKRNQSPAKDCAKQKKHVRCKQITRRGALAPHFFCTSCRGGLFEGASRGNQCASCSDGRFGIRGSVAFSYALSRFVNIISTAGFLVEITA